MLELTNTTITGNEALFFGGGMYMFGISANGVLRNTIIAGNRAMNDPEIGGTNPIRSAANLIGLNGLDYIYQILDQTLADNAGADGSIDGIAAQNIDYGANGSTVTAVPDPDFQFVNWSDGWTLNPRTDMNVMANITVTANVTAKVDLIFEADFE